MSLIPQGSSPPKNRSTDTVLAPPATAEEAVLREYYPMAYRVAVGLCGTPEAARLLLPSLAQRGVKALPRWRDNADAHRWFLHHTVLATRDLAVARGSVDNDTLVPPGGVAGPGYTVFIATLRGLNFQQREAFLLHFGEDQDTRGVAIAMDCSTEAAKNHLLAATSAIIANVSGRPEFDACVQNLRTVWQSLTPAMRDVVADTRRLVRGSVWRKRLQFVRGTILSLVTAALIALLAWFVLRQMHHL
jgi:DNA-directed RNA polymerase specialized sigma24 family protein